MHTNLTHRRLRDDSGDSRHDLRLENFPGTCLENHTNTKNFAARFETIVPLYQAKIGARESMGSATAWQFLLAAVGWDFERIIVATWSNSNQGGDSYTIYAPRYSATGVAQ